MDLESELPCRFCLNEAYSSTNPMITPCACDGTAKFIHMNCLQKWIRSKCVEKQTTVANSYYWKSLDCEVCKKPYPMSLQSVSKNADLIDIPKPNSDYFILETLSKERQNSRIMHVVNMQNKKQVVLGRGHDSDVRISDISVSRSHAIINFHKNNEYYLEDNNSKFGTLIQIKKPIVLNTQENIAIQIGRTVISFSLKKIQTGKQQAIGQPLDATVQGQIKVQGQVPRPVQSESSEEEFISFEEEISNTNAANH